MVTFEGWDYWNSQETSFSGFIIMKGYFPEHWAPYHKDAVILVSTLSYLFALSTGKLGDKILACLTAAQQQLLQIWVCSSGG